jgi:hypothetical protein
MPILKSPQREKFAQLRANGSSQYEAYLEAYPKSKEWSRNVVDVKASELASDGKVLVRINDLKEEIKNKIQDELVYTARQSFDELERLKGLSAGLEKPDIKAAIKAEELRGKLARLYVEQKELSGSITATVKHDTVLGRIADILTKSDKEEK